MAETITIDLPRPGLHEGLLEQLAAHGLTGEAADGGGLRVRFADERERLVCDVVHAIEGWLAASELPLIVERGNGGCVLRPPGD